MIACCPNGDVVVHGFYFHLYILDSEGNNKMSFASTGKDPNKCYVAAVAVSPLGYILLVNNFKWVFVFDLDYKYLHCFDTLTPDDNPNTGVDLWCITVDKSGQVLVGDRWRDIITIHSCPDGKVVSKVKCTLGRPSMVVNSKNQILFHTLPSFPSEYSKVVAIDYLGNEVFSFTPRIDKDVPGEHVWQGGIVCDEEDYIYIVMKVSGTENTGHIHKYSPTGGFVQCIAQGLYSPYDLSFSPDGSLAVANNNTILQYSRK